MRDIVERAEEWLEHVETEVDADIVVRGLLDEVCRLRDAARLNRLAELERTWIHHWRSVDDFSDAELQRLLAEELRKAAGE